ncbi:MAG: sigma-54-dependent Fis family transcriptional regulator [Pseudomonadota bacterium]
MTQQIKDNDSLDTLDRTAVSNAWKNFVQRRSDPTHVVRDTIGESWHRCVTTGIDPQTQRAPFVEDQEALDALCLANKALVDATQNTWQLLSQHLLASDSILILTDNQGVMLDIKGNSEIVAAAAQEHVAPGFDWSEQAAGTNAVGTALVAERPTVVRSVEHFCEAAKLWDCAAAPIRDLADGEIIGVLDITSVGELNNSHALSFAITAAKQIEHTLHSLELARSVELLSWYRKIESRYRDKAAALLDRKGRLIVTTTAAGLLNPPDKFLIDETRLLEEQTNVRISQTLEYEWDDATMTTAPNEWAGGLVMLEAISLHQTAQTTRNTHPAFDKIITENNDFIACIDAAERMARAHSPVLINGETGSGKELFASAIHASSDRADGPFIAVNCGTLTQELAASELFGYESGAFTGAAKQGRRGKFEDADGGTLFLDEIAELPNDVQAHLLRVLQDNVVTRVGSNTPTKVDVRVIAATNKNLQTETDNGRFRLDLLYRLKVLSLDLLPLRARKDDIPVLIDKFLERLHATYGLGQKSISPDLLQQLIAHPWPGNVRELHGVIESIYILNRASLLTTEHLPNDFNIEPGRLVEEPRELSRHSDIDSVEKQLIAQALSDSTQNLESIAQQLGISRSTLYRKMKRYDLSR